MVQSKQIPILFVNVLCLTPAILFLFYYTWHLEFVDLLSDSAIYLLLASALTPFQSIPDSVFDIIIGEYHLPPGYSLALGLLGGGALAPTTSHIINTAFLALALVCYLYWLTINHASSLSALLLTVIFAFLPATLFYSNFILSEHLYLVISILCFVILEKSRTDQRFLFLAAALVGFGMLTRSIGITLIPALLIATIQIDRRKIAGLGLLCLIPPVSWALLQWQLGSSNYFESVSTSYDTGVGLFDQLESALTTNAIVFWLSWIKSFDHFLTPYSRIACSILGLFVLTGWMHRLTNLKPDAVYVGIYVAVLLVWPHPGHMHRFLFPILPFLLFYGIIVIQNLCIYFRQLRIGKMLSGGYLAVLVFLVLPTDVHVLTRFFFTPAPENISSFSRSQVWLFSLNKEIARQDTDFIKLLYASMRDTGVISDTECIWSIDPPRHMLLSLRASRQTPATSLSQQAFSDTSKRCGYFFVMNVTPTPNPHGYPALYPYNRILDRSEVIQHTKHVDFGNISLLLKSVD